MSFALPNYNKEETEERRHGGYWFLTTWLFILWEFKSRSFLPCIDIRYIILCKKKKNHLIHVDSPKDSKFASDVQDYD